MQTDNIADEYSTEDLDEASYLEAHGLRHSSIERTENNRCVFVFRDRARALILSREFTDSESAEFARARRSLAWKLHRV